MSKRQKRKIKKLNRKLKRALENIYALNNAVFEEATIEAFEEVYTRDNLISFGNFMMSKEREKLFFETHQDKGAILKERLKKVHESDIENWIFKNGRA